jgi:hypothetical protein
MKTDDDRVRLARETLAFALETSALERRRAS